MKLAKLLFVNFTTGQNIFSQWVQKVRLRKLRWRCRDWGVLIRQSPVTWVTTRPTLYNIHNNIPLPATVIYDWILTIQVGMFSGIWLERRFRSVCHGGAERVTCLMFFWHNWLVFFFVRLLEEYCVHRLVYLLTAVLKHTHPHPPHVHDPHVHVHSGPLVSCVSDQDSCLRRDH